MNIKVTSLKNISKNQAFFLLIGFLFFSIIAKASVNHPKLNKLDGYQEVTDEYLIEARVIDEGLNHPWALVWLDETSLLVSERPGTLLLYQFNQDGSFEKQQISGLPEIISYGQGGLLDLETHPNYLISGWIYATYSAPNPNNNLESATTLARFRVIEGQVASFEVLCQTQPFLISTRHYGSRIAFDNQNKVIFTSGDRGLRHTAQDIEKHTGKLIRLNADGSVPEDNPFVQSADIGSLNPTNESRFIYSYGHRNPQGIAILGSKVFINEHGPKGGDEFNLVESKKNYGWPKISYGREYLSGLPVGQFSAPGMEQPLFYWDPSIAPSGLVVYNESVFEKWQGDFLMGSLVFGELVRLVVNEKDEVQHEEKILNGKFGRIRDVGIGGDGYVYFVTDSASGMLVQLKPVLKENQAGQ